MIMTRMCNSSIGSSQQSLCGRCIHREAALPEHSETFNISTRASAFVARIPPWSNANNKKNDG